jgi:hypothetical protein
VGLKLKILQRLIQKHFGGFLTLSPRQVKRGIFVKASGKILIREENA